MQVGKTRSDLELDSLKDLFIKNCPEMWRTGSGTRGSIIYSLKSLNQNLGFFHTKKIVSWEPGPEVLFKTKNHPTQKITNEGC
jgi:hypothetical protein